MLYAQKNQHPDVSLKSMIQIHQRAFYGCQNKHQILEDLSSSYIANKVTVYDQDSNVDLCIHISEDMYGPLASHM
jgi:hypothetical protein